MANNSFTRSFFIVGNGALQKTGNLHGTSNAINLADGQVGVISVDAYSATKASNAFLAGGETMAQVGRVKIVQGTSKSADLSTASNWKGLGIPAYEETCEIHAESVRTVSANLIPVGQFSAEVFSGFTVPTVSRTYSLNFDLQSIRNDRDYGYNDDDNYVDFTIPATATAAVDYLLCNLLYNANLYSKIVKSVFPDGAAGNKSVVFFGVDVDGAATGTALGTLVVGDTIPFIKIGTVTYNYTVTKEFLATVKNLIANSVLTASSEIVIISKDPTEAAATEIDAFIAMGTDHTISIPHDDIYATKVRVKVELGNAFIDSTSGVAFYTKEKGSDPIDDLGTGRVWEIKYNDGGSLNYNLSLAGNSDTLIKAPTYINPNTDYVANVIMGKAADSDDADDEYAIYILNARRDNTSALKAYGWYKILNNTTILLDTITVDGTALVEGTAFTAGADVYATAVALAAAINGNGTIAAKVTAVAKEEYVLLTAVTAGTAANAFTLAQTGGGSEVSAATMLGGLAAATGATGVTSQNADPLFVEELNDVLGTWIKSQNHRFDAVGASTITTLFA